MRYVLVWTLIRGSISPSEPLSEAENANAEASYAMDNGATYRETMRESSPPMTDVAHWKNGGRCMEGLW